METKILHLVLKRRWFEAVQNGKKIEYRDMTERYKRRLCSNDVFNDILHDNKPTYGTESVYLQPKYNWKYVCFHLGYTNTVAIFRFDGLFIESPVKEWFPHERVENFEKWAKENRFYAIHLGEYVGNDLTKIN